MAGNSPARIKKSPRSKHANTRVDTLALKAVKHGTHSPDKHLNYLREPLKNRKSRERKIR